MPELLSFVLVGLWIYCLIDIATSDATLIRSLPKWAWFVLTVILPPVGAIGWWLGGRPLRTGGTEWAPRADVQRPARVRRGRAVPVDAVEDEATVRARIEERDRLLARWAEEDRRRQQDEPPAID